MGSVWGITWDEMVLLYLYRNEVSYISDLMRKVTKHPTRTMKIVNRLEHAGLVRTEYKPMFTPNGKPLGFMRIIYLTDKGKEYVESRILPKLKDLIDKGYIDSNG